MHKSLVLSLVVVAFAAPLEARADETPRTGVVDRAGVMKTGEVQQLNAWLLELEQKTGAQLKVLIVPSTNGQDIYQYSIDMARRWRLGQKDKNNGALVAIAVNDRKWHIQTGEGIEHALPDLLCDQIAETYFVPYFKKGDYSHGVFLGTIELARTVAQDAGVELGGLPAQAVQRTPRTSRPRGRMNVPPGGKSGGAACCALIVPLIIVLIVFSSLGASARRMNRSSWAYGRRRGFSPGGFFAGMLLNSMLNSSSRGGSSWGSGFGDGGGGGGGGFGGGGGGSFGGGGAGGSW